MQDEMNDYIIPYYKDPDSFVSVVRCRECLYYAGKQYGEYGRCDRNHTWMRTDSYCSEGVRRNG